MRYYVNLGERTVEIDIGADGVRVDGRPVAAELRAVEGTKVRHMIVDGRSLTIIAQPGEARTWQVHLDGLRFEAEVLDERTRAIRELTGRSAGPRGPKPVRAPMPGLIVRIEVELGQKVANGQGVAVIEAMKMENELRADGGGTVARILVAPGEAVQKGAVLVEFESG
jgi:pyruvate carboxylase subunit B